MMALCVVMIPLSPRQRQILILCARNLTNEEIGVRLGIKPDTVKSHLYRAFARLGVNSRIEAVVEALIHGHLDLESLRKPAA